MLLLADLPWLIRGFLWAPVAPHSYLSRAFTSICCNLLSYFLSLLPGFKCFGGKDSLCLVHSLAPSPCRMQKAIWVMKEWMYTGLSFTWTLKLILTTCFVWSLKDCLSVFLRASNIQICFLYLLLISWSVDIGFLQAELVDSVWLCNISKANAVL